MDAQSRIDILLPTIWCIFIKSYQIVPDRNVDTTGHEKYVVDGCNAVQKRYLATCLRMRSTPEVVQIDSKRICIDAKTEKGEVSFAK